MMTVKEIRGWLRGIPKDYNIGVDDSGLCLSAWEEPKIYLEIGGLPEDEDEEST